jgi:excisionase family DNA binding protein
MSSGFVKVDDLDEVKAGIVKRDTVYRLVAEGKIPALRLSKRRLLVPKDWTERLLRAQQDAEALIENF